MDKTPETNIKDKSTVRITGEAFVVGFFSTLGMLTAFSLLKNKDKIGRTVKAIGTLIVES